MHRFKIFFGLFFIGSAFLSADLLIDKKTYKNLDFGDYNFDGYSDIGIKVTKEGSEELNDCFDYYVYNPMIDSFRQYLKRACNIQLHRQVKIIIEHKKLPDNSFAHAYYHIGDNGIPKKILTGISFPLNMEQTNFHTKWHAKMVTIKSERAYFYDVWNGKKTNSYLVKGDSVSISSIESFDEVFWVKAIYQDKQKRLENWIKFDDLLFEEIVE